MWLLLIFWVVIIVMLYKAYKVGESDEDYRSSYRQSNCGTCEYYNYYTHHCVLDKDPSNCYCWEHTDDDYYLQDDDK